jgi:hypothetical protein
MLPPLHTFQLSGIIKRDDTVDLAIRMFMILSGVFFLAVHPDGGDAQVLRLVTWQGHLRPSILWAIHLDGSAPTFILADTLADELTEVLVEWVPRSIVLIEVCFELMAGCAAS